MSHSSPKPGDLFTATARDLASDGRGIVAHPSGVTVFVPGIWPEETARIKFIRWQKKVGIGELVELQHASSARIQPLCEHHGFHSGACGGCPWQYINYDAQLAAKQRRVEQMVARFWSGTVNSIWAAPQAFAYRNRAQLKTDGKAIGYMSAGSNQLAAIQHCPILTEKNQHTLAQLQQGLPNPAWRPKKKHDLNTLHIDESLTADEIVVNQRLLFQQSNTAQNQRMQTWLQEKIAGLSAQQQVLELFCGAGNFTKVLADYGFEKIVAVDGQGPAIAQLATAELPGVTALAQDLFSPTAFHQLHKQHGPFEVLLLDPPRDGLKHREGLINTKHPFEMIAYISCNLATFARDAQYFIEHGYQLNDIQPLDQTPHTPHIELLASFSRY